ncbi:MAG: peptide ABC transporter substrate-binding protein, partial [Proteobacteria bacterium]|nr:peptide ABC transporter substrate-binding protein [Pseudomonadota bacterium]
PEAFIARIPLTGDLPSPINPPSGCPFHPRCPEAMDVCAHDFPNTKELSPGHETACWLHATK